MTDPFAMRTLRQRAVVMAAILLYMALFVVEIVTGNTDAGGVADLVLAALALPASVVVLRRAMRTSPPDRLAILASVAFLVAGVAIGYEGIAALTDREVLVAVQAFGSLALITALGAYLYRARQTAA